MNSIEHELRKLEECLLRPEVRRDSVACARLLDDDFCEFGSSGTIFTKSQILQALKKGALNTEPLNTEPPTHFSIDDFRVRIVAPGAALVTYRVTRRSETERPSSHPHPYRCEALCGCYETHDGKSSFIRAPKSRYNLMKIELRSNQLMR